MCGVRCAQRCNEEERTRSYVLTNCETEAKYRLGHRPYNRRQFPPTLPSRPSLKISLIFLVGWNHNSQTNLQIALVLPYSSCPVFTAANLQFLNKKTPQRGHFSKEEAQPLSPPFASLSKMPLFPFPHWHHKPLDKLRTRS